MSSKNSNEPPASKKPKKSNQEELPLIPVRYHGKGCTMEICVLERHEPDCPYRKEGNSGRSVDDRSGSYEVIGRLTYRTCKQNEDDGDMMYGQTRGSPSRASNVSYMSDEIPIDEQKTKTPKRNFCRW